VPSDGSPSSNGLLQTGRCSAVLTDDIWSEQSSGLKPMGICNRLRRCLFSDANNSTLTDHSLSRCHCRLFFFIETVNSTGEGIGSQTGQQEEVASGCDEHKCACCEPSSRGPLGASDNSLGVTAAEDASAIDGVEGGPTHSLQDITSIAL